MIVYTLYTTRNGKSQEYGCELIKKTFGNFCIVIWLVNDFLCPIFITTIEIVVNSPASVCFFVWQGSVLGIIKGEVSGFYAVIAVRQTGRLQNLIPIAAYTGVFKQSLIFVQIPVSDCLVEHRKNAV